MGGFEGGAWNPLCFCSERAACGNRSRSQLGAFLRKCIQNDKSSVSQVALVRTLGCGLASWTFGPRPEPQARNLKAPKPRLPLRALAGERGVPHRIFVAKALRDVHRHVDTL